MHAEMYWFACLAFIGPIKPISLHEAIDLIDGLHAENLIIPN